MYSFILAIFLTFSFYIKFTISYHSQCINHGTIALTFDIEENFNTKELLNLLKSKNIKANFFYSINALNSNIKEDNLYGHEVGLFINSLKFLGSNQKLKKEFIISKVEQFKKLNSIPLKWIHVQSNHMDSDLSNLSKELGLITLKSNQNYFNQDIASLLRSILVKDLKQNSFILNFKLAPHFDFVQFYKLINQLNDTGYHFISLNNCIRSSSTTVKLNRRSPYPGNGVEIYNLFGEQLPIIDVVPPDYKNSFADILNEI